MQLVALLQTCGHFKPWHTRLQDHLDNTIRVLEGLSGAWAAGNSQVMFFLRCGSRARFMARRDHRQPVDLTLMNALGYLPDVVFGAMAIPRTVVRLARTTRFYPTGQGHVEVQEMEARVNSSMFTVIKTPSETVTRFCLLLRSGRLHWHALPGLRRNGITAVVLFSFPGQGL